jgi:hypothetical protein
VGVRVYLPFIIGATIGVDPYSVAIHDCFKEAEIAREEMFKPLASLLVGLAGFVLYPHRRNVGYTPPGVAPQTDSFAKA